jgi:uncharacterized protein (DUF1501 family)
MSSRRSLLKLCGLAGLGLAVPYTSASAWEDLEPARQLDEAGYAGPYYVVFNASGGWDTTYLMDPKGTAEINRLYDTGDIQTQGAHHFAPLAKHAQGGLTNEAFYAEFGNELLTLNGLDYSVDNHAPASRYMATGKLDSQAYPTFAALVAACQGASCPLAFLTFGNYSVTGNLVAMSRVPYLSSLQRIANADAIHGNERSPYHDRFALSAIEQTLDEHYQARAAQARMPRVQRGENMLYAAQTSSQALRRVTEFIPSSMPDQRLCQQAEIALVSFKAGVCVSANLNIGQFDSHANNDQDQMKLIPELLEGIAYLLRRAEEMQIRERLVVIVQSEMGRTPHYNAGDGKDHWSIGSIMFLGPGIEGNRVLGGTDDRQFAKLLDPQTGKLEDGRGIRVRPEHIHSALRELAGIAEHPYSQQFPLSVPDDQRLRCLWSSSAVVRG